MSYDILYKTFMCAKPLRVWFDKVCGLNKVYDGTKYLVLFCPERYDDIYDSIRVKKLVLHTILIVILQELELIHIILYL